LFDQASSEANMIDLKGLSAFPITPSDRNGNVDAGALRAVLSPLLEAGVDSIGLLGSTGTYPYFTREERRRAVETTMEQVAGQMPVLVGIGALRTDDAVKLANDARVGGAAVGLLAPVSYTPLTDEEVFQHFTTVVRESGLPICIYDNPGTTHFRFSADLLARLGKVEGIVGLKSPAPDVNEIASHLSGLRGAVPPGFSLGYSADWNCVEALLAGGDTWYSVLGGICPRICVAIARAVEKGDAPRARELNERLRPVWDLFKTHSGLRVAYAMAEKFCAAQPPLPILPLPPLIVRTISETIASLRLD
jgi:4-hydroxy-tetrahydrodipicolinate synthase